MYVVYICMSVCVLTCVCMHIHTHTYIIYCEVLCTMTCLDAIIVILARPDYCDTSTDTISYCDTSSPRLSHKLMKQTIRTSEPSNVGNNF